MEVFDRNANVPIVAVVLHEPEKCVVHPLTADAKFTHGVSVGKLLAT